MEFTGWGWITNSINLTSTSHSINLTSTSQSINLTSTSHSINFTSTSHTINLTSTSHSSPVAWPSMRWRPIVLLPLLWTASPLSLCFGWSFLHTLFRFQWSKFYCKLYRICLTGSGGSARHTSHHSISKYASMFSHCTACNAFVALDCIRA